MRTLLSASARLNSIWIPCDLVEQCSAIMCMIDRLFCSGNLTIGSSVVGSFIDGCGGVSKSALKHPSASTTSLYQSHSSNWQLESILRISSLSRWAMASSILLASSIVFSYMLQIFWRWINEDFVVPAYLLCHRAGVNCWGEWNILKKSSSVSANLERWTGQNSRSSLKIRIRIQLIECPIFKPYRII